MQYLMYALFIALFLKNAFPVGLNIMPQVFNYTVDVFAVLIFIIILLRISFFTKIEIDRRYILLLTCYIVIIIVGIIANLVNVEPLLIGIRFHMKYLPFFILPMVYAVSAEGVRKQIRIILPLLLLQLPVVLLQRFLIFRGFHADFITGTLGVSSHLSMLLICAIAVVFAYYLKRRINLKSFLILALILFLPMTMNETKSTIILLPIALALPAYFLPRIWASSKIRNIFTVGVLTSFLIITFTAVFQQTEGYGIIEEYQKELQGRGYLYTGSEGKLGQKKIGRIDTVFLALKDQSKDLGNLVFGLGTGNVIFTGAKNKSFSGEYTAEKLRYHGERITLTHQFWELGLAGVFCYLGILFSIFKDSLLVSKMSNIYGVLALGWTANVPIVCVAVIYKNIIFLDALYILFWYFSGIIVVQAHRLRVIQQSYWVTQSGRSSMRIR
jgi:hypothetical protein